MLNKPLSPEEALKRKRKREQEQELPVLEKKAHAVPASAKLKHNEAGAISSFSLAVINAKVRLHFSKGKLKSCNKMYLWDKDAPPPQDAKLTQKHLGRNAAAFAIRPHMVKLRDAMNAPGLSNLDIGSMVMNMDLPVGNCGEMSFAALQLAYEQNVQSIWLCRIGSPGDHTLCIVTKGETPEFTNVSDFPKDRSGAWALDPWANIVCELKDYVTHFNMKMQTWADQRKWVRFHATPDLPGQWMLPTSPLYTYGFMFGRVELEKGW